MSIQKHLQMAKKANDYVRSKMTLGASNKLGDLLKSGFASYLCVRASRSTRPAMPAGKIPAPIRMWAAKAESLGCGNCGEQTALAFVQLDRLGERPLDFMMRQLADHAFVVVGRRKGSRAADPRTWGAEAVVCDPWEGKVYPATELQSKMAGLFPVAPRSICRLD